MYLKEYLPEIQPVWCSFWYFLWLSYVLKLNHKLKQLKYTISSTHIFMSLIAPIKNLCLAGHITIYSNLIIHIQSFWSILLTLNNILCLLVLAFQKFIPPPPTRLLLLRLATTLHDLVLCQYCRASMKMYLSKCRDWNKREDGTGNME